MDEAQYLINYIGQRVRDLRGIKSLRELGDETGLSPSFISELERGNTSASIRSLVNICTSLGTTLPDLLAPLVNNPMEPYNYEAEKRIEMMEVGQIDQLLEHLKKLRDILSERDK